MENENENRPKDSSGIDAWVKVLAIMLIILFLLFGVGIIAKMVRSDSAKQAQAQAKLHAEQTQWVLKGGGSTELIPTNNRKFTYRFIGYKDGPDLGITVTLLDETGSVVDTRKHGPSDFRDPFPNEDFWVYTKYLRFELPSGSETTKVFLSLR